MARIFLFYNKRNIELLAWISHTIFGSITYLCPKIFGITNVCLSLNWSGVKFLNKGGQWVFNLRVLLSHFNISIGLSAVQLISSSLGTLNFLISGGLFSFILFSAAILSFFWQSRIILRALADVASSPAKYAPYRTFSGCILKRKMGYILKSLTWYCYSRVHEIQQNLSQ